VGILNGTCNFILSRMTSTESMSAVLEEAQRLGYAEADPSSDIDGHDAAAKLVLLAGVSFRRHLKVSVVPTMSIRRIDNVDCLYASRVG
jgi:homoserine dehydrogenase